jgi:hypothetical protein
LYLFLVILLAVLLVLAVASLLGLVSFTFSTGVSGFLNSQVSTTVTDSSAVEANPTIPAAQPATLTTRTSNTAGTLTMTNTSHGITTGQRIDLYWTGGQCFNATVGTVSGTSVPFTLVSGGSSLPIATTVVGVGIATSTAFVLTGNNLTALVYVAPVSGWFVTSTGSADENPQYVLAGQNYSWFNGNGAANPLASEAIATIWISHSSQTGAVTGMLAAAAAH